MSVVLSQQSVVPERRIFRVLIVEDNAGDVGLLKEAFREVETPHSIFVANDGLDALDFVHKRHNHPDKPTPDVVLLDINLPRLTGHEVLREIKTHPVLRSVVVLMLSSSAEHRDVIDAYDAQANGYLRKPFEVEDYFRLARAIEKFWFRTALIPVPANSSFD